MRPAYVFWTILGGLSITQTALGDLWTTPVPVAEINTEYSEGAPFLTYDGSTLYFSRQGPHPQWLYSATRTSPDAPFGTPEALTAINGSGSSVNYSWVSPEGLRLYYYAVDGPRVIKLSERASPGDPWPAGNDVPELNALGGVANPSLTPDELTIVFTGTSVPGGLGSYDIWIGTRPDTSSPFGDFRNLVEVNSSSNDAHPRLSADGLTLYFASHRDGGCQLFQATRADADSAFGAPERLEFLNLPDAWLEYPSVSADGTSLYFAVRTAETSYDIYISHPVPLPGAILLGLLGLGAAGWHLKREM